MMASGEIRLSGMTMRRMPVLAQSQASPSQTSSDGLQEIVVTAQAQGPVLAQLVDPIMDALTQFGRVPTELETQLGRPTYTPRVGVPQPLPPPAPPTAPWYILLMQALGEWVERGAGVGAAPPICIPSSCWADLWVPVRSLTEREPISRSRRGRVLQFDTRVA
jgi:hypothetical protein